MQLRIKHFEIYFRIEWNSCNKNQLQQYNNTDKTTWVIKTVQKITLISKAKYFHYLAQVKTTFPSTSPKMREKNTCFGIISQYNNTVPITSKTISKSSLKSFFFSLKTNQMQGGVNPLQVLLIATASFQLLKIIQGTDASFKLLF